MFHPTDENIFFLFSVLMNGSVSMLPVQLVEKASFLLNQIIILVIIVPTII